MLPFAPRVFTGIDIGSYAVKAVSLTGSKGSFTLKSAACVKLPRNESHGNTSVSFLTDFIRQNNIKRGRTAALMTGHSLMFRHFYLPQMPDKDLKEAVKWEIRKEVAIPPSELISDYVLAGNAVKTADNSRSIIAFAAVRKEVDAVIALFKGTGLDLKLIEVIPTVLLASFDANNTWEPGVNYAMLDVGETKSTLAIFKDRQLSFAREFSLGGQDLTRALAAALKKGEDEADELKLSTDAGRGGEGGMFLKPLEKLCSELQRSFNYYQAQFREGAVSKLFLTGGSARLKGLDYFITDTIGVQAFVDDPFKKIRIPKEAAGGGLGELAPVFSTAMGLAVRAAGS